jgi:hypothetical protein
MPRWWQSPVRSSEQRTGTFDPTTYRDRYREALRELIEAKMKGVAIKPREVSTPPPVIDLMAALKLQVVFPRTQSGARSSRFPAPLPSPAGLSRWIAIWPGITGRE